MLQGSSGRLKFTREIVKISPVRIVIIMLFLHLLDISTAFLNFAFNYQGFRAYEANSLLRDAWINGNLISQIKIEALVLVLLVMAYIFLTRKPLPQKFLGYSFGLVTTCGFSVAVATNIMCGFLLSPSAQNYGIFCLMLGWAIWLAVMQFAMKVDITLPLLALSILPLLGGGLLTLFGPNPGALDFLLSVILLWIILLLASRTSPRLNFGCGKAGGAPRYRTDSVFRTGS
jgi:hypothetical protein